VKRVGKRHDRRSVTVRPRPKIYEAQEIMRSFRISGVPVVDEFNKLVRHPHESRSAVRDAGRHSISEVMTKDRSSRWPVGTSSKSAKGTAQTPSSKVAGRDEHFTLKGLITVKDIQKKVKYPNADKTKRGVCGRRCIGATGDFLERARNSSTQGGLLVVDTAHGQASACCGV